VAQSESLVQAALQPFSPQPYAPHRPVGSQEQVPSVWQEKPVSQSPSLPQCAAQEPVWQANPPHCPGVPAVHGRFLHSLLVHSYPAAQPTELLSHATLQRPFSQEYPLHSDSLEHRLKPQTPPLQPYPAWQSESVWHW
jgi:hypothetical protein